MLPTPHNTFRQAQHIQAILRTTNLRLNRHIQSQTERSLLNTTSQNIQTKVHRARNQSSSSLATPKYTSPKLNLITAASNSTVKCSEVVLVQECHEPVHPTIRGHGKIPARLPTVLHQVGKSTCIAIREMGPVGMRSPKIIFI